NFSPLGVCQYPGPEGRFGQTTHGGWTTSWRFFSAPGVSITPALKGGLGGLRARDFWNALYNLMNLPNALSGVGARFLLGGGAVGRGGNTVGSALNLTVQTKPQSNHKFTPRLLNRTPLFIRGLIYF